MFILFCRYVSEAPPEWEVPYGGISGVTIWGEKRASRAIDALLTKKTSSTERPLSSPIVHAYPRFFCGTGRLNALTVDREALLAAVSGQDEKAPTLVDGSSQREHHHTLHPCPQCVGKGIHNPAHPLS